ncbi:Fructose-1,6-bisphosphatase class 1 (plasmid) [Pseudomonas putida]|uniref:Fructose-1,6-bisphosphatase class 1 n=1 Tax=Pseudomonas putida TaxID=303 RepID=A0A1L7NM68_PSEPU|nr:Fructose-1,6-bisphosphatase class 1 [Pseudomonas putida]
MQPIALTKVSQPGITQVVGYRLRGNATLLAGELPEQLHGFTRTQMAKRAAAQSVSHCNAPPACEAADAQGILIR